MYIQAMLHLYNTETKKKEAMGEPRPITLYTCGPTIYSFAHIGNFRTYVFEDLLRRTLKFFGFEVRQVMNLTDVDDKTIKGAIAEGVGLKEFVEPYRIAFFQDLDALGIERAEEYPAATDYVKQMIVMIEKLIEKGVAYVGKDGSVYFSIAKFPNYGRLSHLKLDELKEGARVASDEYDKESASDFVLWKGYDEERDGQIFWESPFGKGRPGWHLECSCMAMELLGETVDIHVGGVDNIFPHHENEIAQSEGVSGCQFVKHWMHSEHLIVDGKKMSKSLGNFYTLRDLLERGHTGREVRYMLMHTHYRAQLNFTFEEASAVRHSLDRLDSFVRRLKDAKGSGEADCENFVANFRDAIGDDLNISAALAVLFDFVRDVNAIIDEEGLGNGDEVIESLRKIDTVLNIFVFEEAAVPTEIQEMLERRIQARREKNWALADELRDAIQAAGWAIEDTAEGARVVRA